MWSLAVESWIWYGFVASIAISRFISRTLHLGSIQKLQVDDWTMVLALGWFTVLEACINIVDGTRSNLLEPGFDVDQSTPTDIAARQYGSKMVLVVEQSQCVTIWLAKACILIMYYRLTIALRENIVIKVLAGYVLFGFLFMEIFYFLVWCRPFHDYWAVPTPNIQCSAATHHLITNAVFNLSSDLAMLIVALQMLIRSRLPLHKKLILTGVFGLGVFVILAAVLNKYYSFTQPFGSLWTFWYVRESSTALLVANLPFTWTLLRRFFNLRAFDSLGTSSHAMEPHRHSSPRRVNPDLEGPRSTDPGSPTSHTWRNREMLGRADKDALSMDGPVGRTDGRSMDGSATETSAGPSTVLNRAS